MALRDRDIHLIGDFLIRKIPFQLIQTDLAFLLRQVIDRLVKMRHLGGTFPTDGEREFKELSLYNAKESRIK